MAESFKELFEASIQRTKLIPGAIIPAKVIEVDKASGYVTLNAGLKSEGIVSISEFYNDQQELEVSTGDEVEVLIEQLDDFGQTVLSRAKAKQLETWHNLEKAHLDNQTIMGVISGRVKGGFTVEIGQVRAFLPGSLVDVRPIRDPGYLEGKELEFKVIKMDQKRNNIVVSRRAVVEEESVTDREAFLQTLEEGQEVKGVVKNITDYGAFIDLGGIDGLLHITDISWKRVKHPNEALTVGQEIKVKILKFDRERKRVSLGIKQLGDDPWADLAQRYPQGARISGKVTNITDYGCFVEIESGVEGLVHMSEMDWTNKNVNPNKIVQVGEEVQVMVLEIDQERRRISLGMKQCVSNPWEAFSAKHSKGEKITGNIRSITDFGIFIGLEGDIDGLVHLSDISWNMPGEEAVKQYKKGQEVEAVILSVDPERERISLGIKQLESDPFTNFVEANPKGSIVKGKIIEIDAKIATIELAPEVHAQLKANEISDEKVEDMQQVFKEGDEVEAKIISLDKKNRNIALSIKAKDTQEQSDALRKHNRKEEDAGKATLGDLLKEKISGDKSS